MVIFLKTDLASELGMIQVNITALTHLTKLFGRDMGINGGGRILSYRFNCCIEPGPLMSVYYATKAYVIPFLAIHNELKEKNVLVTTLCPVDKYQFCLTGRNADFILVNKRSYSNSRISCT